MEVCPFTRHDDPVSEKRPTAKVMVGWRRENIGWTFIQLQYRFFFKKCFYKYLFLSSFKFIVCTRTREDSCLIFEAVLCSCRLCLQTIFNLFSKESGSATKKKKKGKTIFFDPMVCLFGLGPQEDRFPCWSQQNGEMRSEHERSSKSIHPNTQAPLCHSAVHWYYLKEEEKDSDDSTNNEAIFFFVMMLILMYSTTNMANSGLSSYRIMSYSPIYCCEFQLRFLPNCVFFFFLTNVSKIQHFPQMIHVNLFSYKNNKVKTVGGIIMCNCPPWSDL